MSKFRGFVSIDQNICGPHTFEKKEVIVLRRKKIISGKISAVEFTQMYFNRR